jgi:hypothetical protein
MKKTPQVTIPVSQLSEQLAQTRAIKEDMLKLLGELELAAVKTDPSRIGGWRHDPLTWARKYNLN